MTAGSYQGTDDDYDATKVAEDTDYAFNPLSASMKDIVFPADTEGEFVVRTATFTLYTNPDSDAEDEDIKISVKAMITTDTDTLSIETGDEAGEEPTKTLTIEDAQTQTYVLDVTTADPKEGILSARPSRRPCA